MGILLFAVFFLLAGNALAEPGDAELAKLESGRHTVPVLVNGEGPFAFLIDTAATSTSLSQNLAGRLGLEQIRENVRFNTVGGQGRADIYRVGRISVAGKDFHLPNALGIARHRLSEKNIDGVLGMDVFRMQPVLFDFRENRLRLYAEGDDLSVFVGGWIETALQPLKDGLPTIQIKIAGSDVTAMFDTGAGLTVANKATSRLLDPTQLSKAPTLAINGAGGFSIKARTIRDVSVTLQDHTLLLSELAVADLPVFTSLKLKIGPAVILGPEVFADKMIILDYANRRFFLRQDQ